MCLASVVTGLSGVGMHVSVLIRALFVTFSVYYLSYPLRRIISEHCGVCN